jgi:uncharacterized protein (TIGR01244 family)
MRDLRQLNPSLFVTGQIAPGDIERLKEAGVRRIVNNRPDGEEPDQPTGAAIEHAAAAAGLDYHSIPVGPAAFGQSQLDAMDEALGGEGTTLAFCRSGTRSTYLWALAAARGGQSLDSIRTAAAQAGYDLTPMEPMLRGLSEGA